MQNIKDSFVCRNLVDSGPFIGCWDVMDRETCDFHYLKIIEKSTLETPKMADIFSSEVSLIGYLNFLTIPKLISFFDDESNFYVVFEKPEGESLLNFINQNGKLDENKAKKFSISFIETMQYLYMNLDSSIQWTISAETIFVKDNGIISQIYIFNKNSSLITLTNEISMKTTAPEVITHNKVSPKCMSWFLGCILFYILNGYFPFEGNNVKEIQHNILYSHPIFISQLSKECFNFIESLLIKNPQMRISIGKACLKPYINHVDVNSKSFAKSLSADGIFVINSIPSSILFNSSFNIPSHYTENDEGSYVSSEIESEVDQSEPLKPVDTSIERKNKKKKKKKAGNNALISNETKNRKEFSLKDNFSYSTDIPSITNNENANIIKKKPQLRHNSSFFNLPNEENKIRSLTSDYDLQPNFKNINLYNNRSYSSFPEKICKSRIPLTPRKFFSPLQSFGTRSIMDIKKIETL